MGPLVYDKVNFYVDTMLILCIKFGFIRHWIWLWIYVNRCPLSVVQDAILLFQDADLLFQTVILTWCDSVISSYEPVVSSYEL